MYSEDVAIQVTNLSKRYEIYSNPRDRLKQFVLPRVQRQFSQPTTQYFREFWALQDVSFEIKKGQTVGVIGRNGSGKSTLLQMICGTLNPTGGHIQTNGRIAALLELGSGFNPEFTGRDNIYLNAALLGLTTDEINNRFDAIAGFADIGQFIDQPVKTYSSGMYVRLAFSVIAHVDADILVVDEALSVGDAVFNQKCMRFIRSFQENGTLLFVSHDMSSVQNLCKSAVWLGQGRVKEMGPSKQVAASYLKYTLQEVYGQDVKLSSSTEEGNVLLKESPAGELINEQVAIEYESQMRVRDNLQNANGWTAGGAEIQSVTLESMEGDDSGIFMGGERVRVVIRAQANKDLHSPILGFVFRDRLGQDLFGENTLPFTANAATSVTAQQNFVGKFVFKLPMLPNGQYAVFASVAEGDLYNNVQHHLLHDALIVNVSSSKIRWGLVGIPFESVVLEVCNDT
jgi:lipopolysaccharide transport system ATP-binding protein